MCVKWQMIDVWQDTHLPPHPSYLINHPLIQSIRNTKGKSLYVILKKNINQAIQQDKKLYSIIIQDYLPSQSARHQAV